MSIPRRRDAGGRILDEVSLACGPGSWTAAMGPSGAGKSTLLYCAAGLLKAGPGTVSIAGNERHRENCRLYDMGIAKPYIAAAGPLDRNACGW